MLNISLETERRIIIAVIVCSCLSTFLMLVAVSTNDWIIAEIPKGIYHNKTTSYIMKYNAGLFRICRYRIDNRTQPILEYYRCRWLKMHPRGNDSEEEGSTDVTVLHYRRSAGAFSIISLIMTVIANCFSIYLLWQLRYMYKRLAACLNLIAAMCMLISLEVFRQTLKYDEKHLSFRLQPHNTVYSHGFSYGLAWTSFILLIAAGVLCILISGKRKREKARSEKEAADNEPVNIGRI